MSPERAASLLDAELRPYPWYLSVGVGNAADGRPALFVYTKSARHRELARLDRGWHGFKVIVKAVGSMRPIAAGSRQVAGR
jgi:hypothetical protein